ncbi:hypothetical protein BGW38_008462, partial [Lunasporangiospora selenospora]
EFATVDSHKHPSFDAMYSCYMTYVGRIKKYGTMQGELKIDMDQYREEHRILLLEGSLSLSRVSASEFVKSSILEHTERQGSAIAKDLVPTVGSSSTLSNPQESRMSLQQESNEELLTSESPPTFKPTGVSLKRGRISQLDKVPKAARHENYQHTDEQDKARTPPPSLQPHSDDIPLAEE